MNPFLFIGVGFGVGAILLRKKYRIGVTVELPQGYVLYSESALKRKNNLLRKYKRGYTATEAEIFYPELPPAAAPALPANMLALPPAQSSASKSSSSKLAVVDVPINAIKIWREKFQNREEAFSQESVDSIVQAAKSNTFNWNQFDAVTLWQSPNGLYMLSGHSRLEAFTQLCAQGFTDFCAIPAQIFQGTEQEAQDIALRSNTLSTKEKETDRAMLYRKMLIAGNKYADVVRAAKAAEKSNANRIMAYAYLNPTGRTFTALKALEMGEPTSQTIIRAIAQWVGEARMKFPQLTDYHEDEMYSWLVNGGFGKVYKAMPDFLRKIAQVLQQRTEFGVFDNSKPLNLTNAAAKSFSEQQFDNMNEDLKMRIKTADETIKAKTADYRSRNATPDQIYSLLQNDYAVLNRLRNELLNLQQRKAQIVNQEQTGSLFGTRRYGIGYTQGNQFRTALG